MASSLLLLLLLLIDCAGPSGTKTAGARATPAPSPSRVAVKPTPRPPLSATLETQKRPGYSLDARPGPDWLDDFRLQVAARSPRLARCFNGSDRGGAIRWTVSVDAKTGAVADHELEPLGGGAALPLRASASGVPRGAADLGGEPRACVTRVLSDPPYLVRDPPPSALPHRVSLVLEF
jgi:hypothetical protein